MVQSNITQFQYLKKLSSLQLLPQIYISSLIRSRNEQLKRSKHTVFNHYYSNRFSYPASLDNPEFFITEILTSN